MEWQKSHVKGHLKSLTRLAYDAQAVTVPNGLAGVLVYFDQRDWVG